MSRLLHFMTHADVVIDPKIEVPDWPLNDRGRARHADGARADYATAISAVYASNERKARDGAAILAKALGVEMQIVPDLHENDRSATGFLPKVEFETVADAFFAQPDQSVRGWEPARAAQSRIVAAVTRIAEQDATPGDIGIVAHGGVGTLLLCHALSVPISRVHDQPGRSGGNVFTLRVPGLQFVSGWRDLTDNA
ncbi:MAG: histidine phosphatase family protein [Pseudomonadota bacterium]